MRWLFSLVSCVLLLGLPWLWGCTGAGLARKAAGRLQGEQPAGEPAPERWRGHSGRAPAGRPAPAPWLGFGGDEETIILSPKGVWYSRLSGHVQAGRDGLRGNVLDLASRRVGLGLDTVLIASPYVEFQFPGRVLGQRLVLGLNFWWLEYSGAFRPPVDLIFHRFVIRAGETYQTKFSTLAFHLRLQVEVWAAMTDIGIFSVAPILLGTAVSHDVRVRDRFNGTGKERILVEGVWPSVGLRLGYQPTDYLGLFAEVLGMQVSELHNLHIAVVHGELRGGMLVKFSEHWGLIGDYTYTYLALQRGRTRGGRSDIRTTIEGPSLSIYASF